MDKIKQEWEKTQLHWDDKEVIQRHKVPKSVIFNWRKINRMIRDICLKAKEFKGEGFTIVDIGCGSGKFLDYLSSFTKKYIGIDPSDKMLSDAPKEKGFFIRGTGEKIPIKGGIADIVLLKSALDQCYSPSRVISESKRVLKSDGLLIISLSNRDSYYSFIRRIYNRLRGHKGEHFFESSHLFYFNMPEVEDMLRKEGFDVIIGRDVSYFVFPRFLEWIIPNSLMTKLIEFADRIGSFILPKKGGAFLIAGKRNSSLK
ncbi:MAG: class I SAM-dependent methyltransferase [Candidatus Poribacteria bacterium]